MAQEAMGHLADHHNIVTVFDVGERKRRKRKIQS